MERITRRIGESIDFVDGKGFANLSHGEGVRLLFEKLAEYEDIGLSPEEIKKVIYGGVPEWIPKYMEYRELDNQMKLIKLPCEVKDLVVLLSSLNYTDKLYIYEGKELLWEGYIRENRIYKFLEDEGVAELYLGVDGLVAKIS